MNLWYDSNAARAFAAAGCEFVGKRPRLLSAASSGRCSVAGIVYPLWANERTLFSFMAGMSPLLFPASLTRSRGDTGGRRRSWGSIGFTTISSTLLAPPSAPPQR